jgi:hypothetical protein
MWPALPLLLLALQHVVCKQDCSAILADFYAYNQREAVPYTGDNLVYFLHIPRTAGRTFHNCLLKAGTPRAKRCPQAYDHLRINFTVPSCQLLSSHDDFSVVEQLGSNAAVVTQVRDPVDRFLSAYEFAIEVAARTARRPANFTAPVAASKTLTTEVWPWSILIPFFKDDIRARMAAAWSRTKVKGGAGGGGDRSCAALGAAGAAVRACIACPTAVG